MKVSFPIAMACYALFGVLAAFTLSGEIRLATLVFLAGIALKTYIAYLRQKSE